jgi:hypothetical protein
VTKPSRLERNRFQKQRVQEQRVNKRVTAGLQLQLLRSQAQPQKISIAPA